MDTDGMFIHISHLKKKKKYIYTYLSFQYVSYMFPACEGILIACVRRAFEKQVSPPGTVSLHHHITCRVMSCDIMLYLFISPFYFTTYHTSDTVHFVPCEGFLPDLSIEARLDRISEQAMGGFFGTGISMNHHESASRCAR